MKWGAARDIKYGRSFRGGLGGGGRMKGERRGNTGEERGMWVRCWTQQHLREDREGG